MNKDQLIEASVLLEKVESLKKIIEKNKVPNTLDGHNMLKIGLATFSSHKNLNGINYCYANTSSDNEVILNTEIVFDIINYYNACIQRQILAYENRLIELGIKIEL